MCEDMHLKSLCIDCQDILPPRSDTWVRANTQTLTFGLRKKKKNMGMNVRSVVDGGEELDEDNENPWKWSGYDAFPVFQVCKFLFSTFALLSHVCWCFHLVLVVASRTGVCEYICAVM